MTMTISKVDTAKLIRAELKAQFPGIKFSVVVDGNAIQVTYTDGPTGKVVNAVCDPMKANSYAHYIFVERCISESFLTKIIDAYCKRYGKNEERPEIEVSMRNGHIHASVNCFKNRELYHIITYLTHMTDAKDIDNITVVIEGGRIVTKVQ